MNIKRCGWLLLNVLCLCPAANGEADSCFTPLYYPAMFETMILQAETGGNPNLMGQSDVLSATGKDPDGMGNGCMCGVKDGRFDLILRKAEAVGPAAVRVVQAHVLSIGGGAEGEVQLIPVTEATPCCSKAQLPDASGKGPERINRSPTPGNLCEESA